MKEEKWNVVHAPGLKIKGSNNAGQDRFMDKAIDSLAREVTQNSLDAHDDDVQNTPTEVVYQTFKLETRLIPGIRQIKNTILPEAEKFWNEKKDSATVGFLTNFRQVLEQDRINVLKISDFNTKGLNKNNYESLVLGESYSVKDSEDSAGSKGIGKAAPFAVSDLRMVFYNSLATDKKERSAGVMNFVSYKHEDSEVDNDYTQDSISFYDKKNQVIDHQTVFGGDGQRTDEFGTDLFIMGLRQFTDFQNEVALATINNFLVAIINQQLVVDVCGKQISKEMLPNLMNELRKWTDINTSAAKRNELKKTRNFYQVLTDEKAIQVHLDSRFKKYDFLDKENLDDEAVLSLLQHEPANRTILQTRKAGMKIYERNRINGNISFSGVFQATGQKLNAFLKGLESADHNNWSAGRQQNEKNASKFLRDLLHFYKDTVDKFDDASTTKIEAFGVKDLLPMDRPDQDNDEADKDSGIQSRFTGEVNVKKSTKSAQVLDGDQEDEVISKEMAEAGIDNGETSGSGSNRSGGAGGNSPDNNFGSGNGKGSKEENNSGQQMVIESERRLNINQSVDMKLIERDYTIGEYQLRLKVIRKIGKAEIELKNIGADGKSYKMNLASVEAPAKLKDGKIIVENIQRNSSVKINYKVKSKLRMKMEGIVNEIKG